MPIADTSKDSIRSGRATSGDGAKLIRKLNIPLLIGTIAVVATLAVAGYFWHGFQVARTADSFIARAETLEAEGDYGAAAGYYQRYLRLRPENVDARVALTKAYDETVNSPSSMFRSIDLHYRALGVAPSDETPALRRRLVELLLASRRFTAAAREATTLANDAESQAEAKRFLAIALYGEYRTSGSSVQYDGRLSVGEAVENAIELNPESYELAFMLAELYREFSSKALSPEQMARPGLATGAKRSATADSVVNKVIENNPTNAAALLARYRYRMSNGAEAEAATDLQAALTHGPEDTAVRLTVARDTLERARQLQQDDDARNNLLQQAEGHFRYVLENLNAENPNAYLGLGDVLMERQLPDDAVVVWREGQSHAAQEAFAFQTRIAKVLIDNDHLEEASVELATMNQQIEDLAPILALKERRSMDRSYQLLYASLAMKTGDPIEAISLLSSAVQGVDAGQSNEMQLQRLLLLGAAYGVNGQWDRAALTYQEAASLDPGNPRPRLAAASAWYRAERLESAVKSCERVLEISQTTEAILLLAQAQLGLQSRLPSGQRDWSAFDVTIQQLKQAQGDPPSWRVSLLEADRAALREGATEQEIAEVRRQSLQQMTKVAQRHQEDPEFQQSFAALNEIAGNLDEAESILASQASSTNGSLRRAEFYSRKEDYGAARSILRKALETAEPAMRPEIIRRLVDLNRVLPDNTARESNLRSLHERFPNNTGILVDLSLLAIEAGDLEQAKSWEQKLAGLEGSTGTLWRYVKVRRLLASSRATDDAPFREAVSEQAKIETRRSLWPITHLLRGQIAERQGDVNQAVAAYKRAIELGDRRIAIYERLVNLLNRVGKFSEASDLLASLQDAALQSPTLSSLALTLAIENKELQDAEDLAMLGLQARPTDAMSHVWHGQVLYLNGKTQQAERAFQRGVEVAGADVRAWNGLFGFYLRTEQSERARETLAAMVDKVSLPPMELAFVLAQCYQSLGDLDRAGVEYGKAAELAPKNPTVHFSRARFYLGRDNLKAEESLRRVLQLEPGHGSSRRALATVLATRGGESEWDEAQRLLEESGANGKTVGANRQLQAMLLARRGSLADLENARSILVELVETPQSTDGDRLLLSQIYVRQSRLPSTTDSDREAMLRAADQLFLDIVAKENPSTGHLATYVDFLLNNGELEKVEPWIEKLDELVDDDFGAIDLKVRWLTLRGERDKIVPLVEQLADDALQNVDDEQKITSVQATIGQIYAKHDLPINAETWYRKLMEIDPKGYVLLANALAKQGKWEAAVGVCREAAKWDDSAQPAIAIAAMLTQSAAPTELRESTKELLNDALKRHRNNRQLLMVVANLRFASEQDSAAIALYEEVLAKSPNDLVVLNNLATMLAEIPAERARALELIDRAIQIAGARVELLDTKGMIQLLQGDFEQAVELLEYSIATTNPDPRYHFHLAAAYFRRNEGAKARVQLQTALDLDLEQQLLTDLDQVILAELKQSLL